MVLLLQFNPPQFFESDFIYFTVGDYSTEGVKNGTTKESKSPGSDRSRKSKCCKAPQEGTTGDRCQSSLEGSDCSKEIK